MASGTIIFRPNADISVSHDLNTGSSGYRLIADTTADDNSTYISQSITSTSSTSVSSVFTLGPSTELPSFSYKITGVRLYSRAMGSSNNDAGTYTCYFAVGTASGGSSNNAATSGNVTSGSYSTINSNSSALVTAINNALETSQEFPIFSVKITTTGTKSSNKNASDGYIRVTQVYAEITYEETIFEPPEEETNVTYYPITISSINATTTPENGTTRVSEGSSQTITIVPTDPILTLATDNGVDITSQLVQAGGYNNHYTITEKKSGATYGFSFNNETGYYVSNNKGKQNSASVARLNFSLETECIVTLSYINYAEVGKDYGIFGKIDVALDTTNISDNNIQYICNTTNDNTASAKTITYNIPAGSHFIDIKYRKDDNTNSNNDTLQWKVSGFRSIEGEGTYTYQLTNITKKHSLMFIFGEVTYYFISSTGNNCRVFPDGQVIVLPGDDYNINIVPNDVNDTVGLTDDGVNVTSSLVKTEGTNKDGQPIACYSYSLSNVQKNHTLQIVAVAPSSKLYVKINNEWVIVTKAYYKENNVWAEKDLSFFSNIDMAYLKKGN